MSVGANKPSLTAELSQRAAFVWEVAERFLYKLDAPQIQSIWLIGSRARGEAKRGSDWDFLVVGEDFDDVEAERIRWLEEGRPIFGMRLEWPVGEEVNDIIFSSREPTGTAIRCPLANASQS